jgi:hypothetical protein
MENFNRVADIEDEDGASLATEYIEVGDIQTDALTSDG